MPKEPAEFSLMLGGPLYQLYLRSKLARPPLELLPRRMIVIPLIAWLPLAALAVLTGNAASGAKVPFLLDLEVHARFLAAVPLLIWAELVVHQRIGSLVQQFLKRDIIAPEDRQRFDGIVASAMGLRNSAGLEVLLIVLAFTLGYWLWKEHVALSAASWYGMPVAGHYQLTLPGYWYAFVSLPIFRFLMFRWYFRIFIWYRFLWQVSGLPLRLNSLHPDRAAGLGFLSSSLFAFAPVLLAHTVTLSGLIANRIWHEAAKLPEFKLEISAMIAILMALVLIPLCFFIIHLAETRRRATAEYAIFSGRYVADFRRKWTEGPAVSYESLLGSADIQSLADLANSFEVVRQTRLLPFGKDTVLRLAIIILLPLLPLTLTMIPLEEMINRLIGILF